MKLDQYDKIFDGIQQEISELKEITSVQNTRINHLEDKVYPVRYDKKK